MTLLGVSLDRRIGIWECEFSIRDYLNGLRLFLSVHGQSGSWYKHNNERFKSLVTCRHSIVHITHTPDSH